MNRSRVSIRLPHLVSCKLGTLGGHLRLSNNLNALSYVLCSEERIPTAYELRNIAHTN